MSSKTDNETSSVSAPSSPTQTMANPSERTCVCSPTKHAGSFRCRLHRASEKYWPRPTSPRFSASGDEDSLFVSAPSTSSLVRLQLDHGTRRGVLNQKKPPSPHSVSRLSRDSSFDRLEDA